MQRYKTVDDYVRNVDHWQAEAIRLREILQGTKLAETIKWGAPCYTWNNKPVVAIAAFKAYVGLWFHQGALLKDEDGVLINAQTGKTKALRQWRFASIKAIKSRQIKAYVREAIENEDNGLKIEPDRSRPIVVPLELKNAFASNAQARTAFKKLTRGRQREYTEYIATAKRADTKQKRVEKILPMIIDNVGLSDRYRSR